jgi:gas vesicle protein
MSRDNQSGSGNVMLAFMVGAITGAAVALLFAPASGDETREYLGQKAREGRDRAREAAEQSDRGREAFQQARERGEQA